MTYASDQSTRRCGPAGLAYAAHRLGIFPTWDEAMAYVLAHWPGGWKDTGDVRDDINDQVDDARAVIESLSRHQTMVTLTDILSGKYPAGTVVVLLHRTATAKHWVVWEETTNSHVRVHWGDGEVKRIPIDDFIDFFTRTFPNAAYTLTAAPPRLSRWQRFRRWLLGLIARRT